MLPAAKVPAVLGVPLNVIVLPLRTAVTPVGKPLTLVNVNGTVPAEIVIVLLKPPIPAVHCVLVKLPIDGIALIVIVNVLVMLPPMESWMVMLPAKTAAAVGVPVIRIVFPDRTADKPVGRPVELAMVSVPVPPATLRVLTKPEMPAVHCVAVGLPIVSTGLMGNVEGFGDVSRARRHHGR